MGRLVGLLGASARRPNNNMGICIFRDRFQIQVTWNFNENGRKAGTNIRQQIDIKNQDLPAARAWFFNTRGKKSGVQIDTHYMEF